MKNTITRTEKRKMKEADNMLKNLFVTMHHYDKDFFKAMKDINDPRNQAYITYPLEVMLVTRILAFCCHIQSMAEMNDDFNHDCVIKNISDICGIRLKNLPHGDTMNDLLKRLDIDKLRIFLSTIVKRMINRRFFEKYRYDNTYYQLVIDGTQLYSYNQNHIEKSLTRTHEDGHKTYHTQSLTAYMIIGERLMVPIDFEIIENEEENATKQDCEIKASKRLLKRIKKTYPRLHIMLSADALYACEPIVEICEKYGWKYIIRVKEGRIASLIQEFEELKAGKYLETMEMKAIKHGVIKETKKYWYGNALVYDNHEMSIAEIAVQKEERTINFMFITNINLNEKNVSEIIKTGRKRWKIENKGFNDEKNHGYGLRHAYSYDENAVKCHYMFLLISHLFMQLLEHYIETKGLKEKIKTIGKEIKEALRFAHLNAKDYVEILRPRQIRQEVPY